MALTYRTLLVAVVLTSLLSVHLDLVVAGPPLPSPQQKGLLGGLLGGGGSDEDCMDSGNECGGGGTCCPTLACVQLPLLGLSLCL